MTARAIGPRTDASNATCGTNVWRNARCPAPLRAPQLVPYSPPSSFPSQPLFSLEICLGQRYILSPLLGQLLRPMLSRRYVQFISVCHRILGRILMDLLVSGQPTSMTFSSLCLNLIFVRRWMPGWRLWRLVSGNDGTGADSPLLCR